MTEGIDNEIEAIRILLTALEPLDSKVRTSVLDYVIRRLGIQQLPQVAAGETGAMAPVLPVGEQKPTCEGVGQVHISQLVEAKKPRNAIQMATLVAYYLSHKAPENDRKQTITTKDVETYFKIANFKLPTSPKYTLPNTKGAGYLDTVGNGEYKLNPVGYNLVVHSMPKSGDGKCGAIQAGTRRKASAKLRKA